VGRFEDKLGLALFERGHAGVSPDDRRQGRVLPHIRRALGRTRRDPSRWRSKRQWGWSAEIRLAVQMPPVGEPLRGLLGRGGEKRHPEVALNHRGIERVGDPQGRSGASHRYRSDDEPYVCGQTAVTAPLYRERLVAVVPCEHPLSDHAAVDWERPAE